MCFSYARYFTLLYSVVLGTGMASYTFPFTFSIAVVSIQFHLICEKKTLPFNVFGETLIEDSLRPVHAYDTCLCLCLRRRGSHILFLVFVLVSYV